MKYETSKLKKLGKRINKKAGLRYLSLAILGPRITIIRRKTMKPTLNIYPYACGIAIQSISKVPTFILLARIIWRTCEVQDGRK